MSEKAMTIAPEEFAERRRRAAEAAGAAGYDGLLVCARGGGTLDRYGDVLYLANYVTSFPYIPDLPGAWRGRAHAFLALRADGACRLIIDGADDGRIALGEDEIRPAEDVFAAVGAVIGELGLERGAIGLVGADVLTVSADRAIRALAPEARWGDAQAILAKLRAVKSPGEIALLRRASEIGGRTLEAMLTAAEPGAAHGDVVAAGMQVLAPAGGALYNSFMASGRGGDDAYMVRRNFPTWGADQPLGAGEWFRIGLSGVVDGYFFDHSRSKAIGAPTNQQIALFEDAIAICEAAIAAIRPGVTAEQVAEAGLTEQTARGYPNDGVFSGLGHGVGMGWDSPWLAPGDKTVIEPNMVLCIERTIRRDGYLGDFEETVVVTEDGCEKITHARIRWW